MTFFLDQHGPTKDILETVLEENIFFKYDDNDPANLAIQQITPEVLSYLVKLGPLPNNRS